MEESSSGGGLRKLKSGALSRTMSLARVTVSAGARAAGHAVGNVFAGASRKSERSQRQLHQQLSALSEEFGQLKGSVMKAGQLLSMLGEYFLPPEANALLKGLQSQSPPMQWSVIAQQLAAEIPAEALARLTIDHQALAAASLGQVHRAVDSRTGRQLALKVQYPGVRQAIGSDLRALRTMLKLGRLLPRGPDYDGLFAEVKQMLEQEADYRLERRLTETFAERLRGDRRYVVPRIEPDFCSERVLATSFEEGVAPDSAEVRALSQGRRNALGAHALNLYMRELWQLGMVQTDPHFGNYRVRLDPAGVNDQLVLLDFGATREVSTRYLAGYRQLVLGAVEAQPERIIAGAEALGFLVPGDAKERTELFTRLCCLVCEPFALPSRPNVRADLFDANGAYDWGRSDLPRRVAKLGSQILLNLSLRTPPREALFLDRKLGGTFIFLSTLGVRLRGRDILAQYLPLNVPHGEA